jgi:hypothetical protein
MKSQLTFVLAILMAAALVHCRSNSDFGFAGSGVTQDISVSESPGDDDGNITIVDVGDGTPIGDDPETVTDTTDDPSSPGDSDDPSDDSDDPPPSVVDNTPNPPTSTDHDGDGITDSQDPDNDNDGIDDEEDNLDNTCTTMRLISRGVSAARVVLNGEDVFTPSDFQNTDFTKDKTVNLQSGTNELEILLIGEPGDSLTVQIFNCSVDPSQLIYSKTLTRVAGKPQSSDDSL